MSMTAMALQTLSSPKPSLLFPNNAAPSALAARFRRRLPPAELRLVSPAAARDFREGFSRKRPELLYGQSARVYAGDRENGDRGGGGDDDGNGERDFRGESTMPERFRHLTKEIPEPPLRWPWFVAAGFLFYAWRAVLFELRNWKLATLAIFGFVVDLSKLVLALILEVIGSPITSLIYGIETAWYTIRAFYSGMIAYTPIPEFTTIIILTTAVLAVAEATVPDSVSSQPYALTIAGVTAYAAVTNQMSDLFFLTVLLLLYGFSRLVKKRDHVSSVLPVAAILAAIGETWVRVLAIVSYFALAIFQHSKKSPEEKEKVVVTKKKPPLPLLLIALAIGTRLAANWAGYRHLTWMIV